ncbi:MAG: chalcone isomerase family protein [Acidobacteriota bacterium]
MNHSTLAATVLTASLAAPLSAETIESEGVAFAKQTEPRPGTSLQLCSAELLRYKVVFRGYVAALYLEDCSLRDDPLADIPKRLELSYFWDIPGEKFGPAGRDILAKNVSKTELATLTERLDTFDNAYRDIEKGDRYTLTYLPGVGTELAHNGESLVTVPGADFGRAYFSIWLGDDPLDQRLCDRLLESPALTPPVTRVAEQSTPTAPSSATGERALAPTPESPDRR